MNEQFDISILFPKPQSVGERPWGTEDLLALVSKKFSVKRLKAIVINGPIIWQG